MDFLNEKRQRIFQKKYNMENKEIWKQMNPNPPMTAPTVKPAPDLLIDAAPIVLDKSIETPIISRRDPTPD